MFYTPQSCNPFAEGGVYYPYESIISKFHRGWVALKNLLFNKSFYHILYVFRIVFPSSSSKGSLKGREGI